MGQTDTLRGTGVFSFIKADREKTSTDTTAKTVKKVSSSAGAARYCVCDWRWSQLSPVSLCVCVSSVRSVCMCVSCMLYRYACKLTMCVYAHIEKMTCVCVCVKAMLRTKARGSTKTKATAASKTGVRSSLRGNRGGPARMRMRRMAGRF